MTYCGRVRVLFQEFQSFVPFGTKFFSNQKSGDKEEAPARVLSIKAKISSLKPAQSGAVFAGFGTSQSPSISGICCTGCPGLGL
jgi:hypothetical protein